MRAKNFVKNGTVIFPQYYALTNKNVACNVKLRDKMSFLKKQNLSNLAKAFVERFSHREMSDFYHRLV